MPLLNCVFDKLSTGQPYLFSRAKPALDSVCTQWVWTESNACHKLFSLTMLIDYYNSSLSKLLNSILYRILLFLCCSDIIQIGRVNCHMQQQRRISLSASLWLKLYWITTVDFQQWWRKEGSRNSFAMNSLLVVVSICISNSILLAAGLYYACFPILSIT